MIMILAMTFVGGIATLPGPVVGAFILTFLAEILRPIGPGRFVIYGVVIIISVFFLPGGLISLREKFKKVS
jgi:branched-chain amino acid transport system permease protein